MRKKDKEIAIVQLVLIYYLFPVLVSLFFSIDAGSNENGIFNLAIAIGIIISFGLKLFFSLKKYEVNSKANFDLLEEKREQKVGLEDKKTPIQAHLIEELQNDLEESKKVIRDFEVKKRNLQLDIEVFQKEKVELKQQLFELKNNFERQQGVVKQQADLILEKTKIHTDQESLIYKLQEKNEELTFELHTIIGVVSKDQEKKQKNNANLDLFSLQKK